MRSRENVFRKNETLPKYKHTEEILTKVDFLYIVYWHISNKSVNQLQNIPFNIFASFPITI